MGQKKYLLGIILFALHCIEYFLRLLSPLSEFFFFFWQDITMFSEFFFSENTYFFSLFFLCISLFTCWITCFFFYTARVKVWD